MDPTKTQPADAANQYQQGPALVAALLRRWSLKIGERLPGGSFSEVYDCVRGDGMRLVLKLPHADFDPTLEAAALRLWNGEGSVRVHAFDSVTGALLLDRILPGTSLPSDDHETASKVAAKVMRKLHAVPVPSATFPTFDDAFEAFLGRARRHADPAAAGLLLLDQARIAARRLAAQASHSSLLHGDLIDKNLLLGTDGYVAIDPAPRIGDPCSDIGVFASFRQPASVIATLARATAMRLGLDPDRAAAWAAVWAIGEACETWRADSDELQRWVQTVAVDTLAKLR